MPEGRSRQRLRCRQVGKPRWQLPPREGGLAPQTYVHLHFMVRSQHLLRRLLCIHATWLYVFSLHLRAWPEQFGTRHFQRHTENKALEVFGLRICLLVALTNRTMLE